MWSFMVLLLIAQGGADKLDRLYLPPSNANYAGGQAGDIEVPFESSKLSQSHSKFPENAPSGFESDRMLTRIDPSKPNIPFISNESYFTIPSTTDQTYAQTSSLPQTDEDVKGLIDTKTHPSKSYENSAYHLNQLPNDLNISKSDSTFKIPLIISSQSNVNSPVHQKILNSMEITDLPLKPGVITSTGTLNSLGSDKDNFSPTSTIIEDANDHSNRPFFMKQYTHQPSLNNAPESILPSKINSGVTVVQRYPERVQAEADRNSVILNFENIITPKGYAYSFDTSNEIHADENGTTVDGSKAKGSYSYIGDDGKNYTVYYTADENGFQPRGHHLPTPPPIPDAIMKAMEQIAENEKNGIFDDGSYDDNKYGYKNYHNPGLRGNALNGNKYTNSGNLLMDKDHSLGISKQSQTPLQSVAPILGGESFLDIYNKDYDTDDDYEDDGEDFRQYKKPMNANIQDQIRNKNNQLHQHLAMSKNAPTSNEKSLPDKKNILPSNLFEQDTPNIPRDHNRPSEMKNLKDVPNPSTYSTHAPVTQSGYQYFTPQFKFTSQTTLFPSHHTVHDGQSIPKSSTLPISQNNEIINQGTRLPYQSQPISYNNKIISPILQNKFQISSNEIDDVFGGNPEMFIDKTSPQVTSKQGDNLFDDRPVNTDKFIPVTDSQYVYPKGDLEFGQKLNNLPNPNSNFDPRYYSTTPMPSQSSTHSGVYRPIGENITPGINFGFSTTVKPSLFTNGPGETGTDGENIVSSTFPIFNEKTKPEEISNKFGNRFESGSQNIGIPFAIGPEVKTEISQPGYASTTTKFGTPEYNLNQNYQPNVYKIQPSTEKFNSEDFSGPEQLQRYDPITGYHYK